MQYVEESRDKAAREWLHFLSVVKRNSNGNKGSVREKAKTIHPDIAGNGHTDGRTFTELREAYEILIGAASTSDAETKTSGAIYGPGMLARFEAAHRWRERQGGRHVPIKAAREHLRNGDTSASNVEGVVNRRGPQQQNLRSGGMSSKHSSLNQKKSCSRACFPAQSCREAARSSHAYRSSRCSVHAVTPRSHG